MAVSDRGPPSDQDEEGGIELDAEQYEWLQQQLLQLGAELHVTDAPTEVDAGAWADPTGGALTRVLDACEQGDDGDELNNALDALRAGGFSVDAPGPDGDAPIHIASLYGSAGCVRALLAAGADPALVNSEDRSTPLHDAAAGGYDAIARQLLDAARGGAAAMVAAADEDADTPLHAAARGAHLATVRLLLERGADPAARNAAGKTPAQESDDDGVRDELRRAVGVAVAAAAAAAAAAAGGGGGAARHGNGAAALNGNGAAHHSSSQES